MGLHRKIKVYVFDLEGILIDVINGMKVVAKKYNIPYKSVESSVRRKCLCHKKLYFSKKKTFEIPKNKWSHNPLINSQTKHSQGNNYPYKWQEVDEYFKSSESYLDFC